MATPVMPTDGDLLRRLTARVEGLRDRFSDPLGTDRAPPVSAESVAGAALANQPPETPPALPSGAGVPPGSTEGEALPPVGAQSPAVPGGTPNLFDTLLQRADAGAGAPAAPSIFDRMSARTENEPPAAGAAPAAEDDLRAEISGLARTAVVDPNPAGTALGRAFERGARGSLISLRSLVDAEGGAAAQQALQQALPYGVESWRDIEGMGSLLTYGAERLAESVPEMAAVTAAAAATVLTGGGAAAAGAAMLGASTAFNTGRNLARQIEETGETNYQTAVLFGGAAGALDAIVPGRLSGAFSTRLLGSIDNVVRDVGEGVAIEGATEAIQQGLEQVAADPENLRVLLAPETPEELQRSDALLEEIIEAAFGGAAAGGGATAGVRAARSAVDIVRNRQATPAAAPLPDPTTAPETVPTEPADPRDRYLERLSGAESSGDPNAQNPLSSAGGLFQFTDATWRRYLKQHRPELLRGRTPEQVRALKRDADLNWEMAERYTDDSEAALRAAGLPVTNATLGVLHRFGQAGGKAVLTAAQRNPDTKLSQVFRSDPKVMTQNPDLQGKTVSDIINFYEQRLGTGNTFISGKRNPTMGLGKVRRREDPAGEKVETLSKADASKVAAEAVQEEVPDAPAAMTDELRSIFEKRAADKGRSPAEGVVDTLQQMAQGTLTVRSQYLSQGEAAKAARGALARLGYDPDTDGPIDVTAPSFKVAPSVRALQQRTRPQRVRLLREQFSDGARGFGINNKTGSKVFAGAFTGLRNLADGLAAQQADALTKASGSAAKNRARGLLNQLQRVSAAMQAAADAVPLLNDMGQTPKARRAARETVVAAFEAVQTYERRTQSKTFSGVLDELQAAIEAYRPDATRKTAAKGEPGYDTYTGALRRAVKAMSGTQQRAANIPPSLTRELDTQVRLASRALAEDAPRRKKDAADAARARDVERTAEAERAFEEAAIDRQRRAKAAERVAAEQNRAASNAPSRTVNTIMHMLQAPHATLTQPPSTPQGRREWQRKAARLAEAAARSRAGTTIQRAIRQGLPLRIIARLNEDVFDPIQYGGTMRNALEAFLDAKHSGDAARRAHMKDAETAMNDAAKHLQDAAKMVGMEAADGHRLLSYFAADATMWKVRLVNLDGTPITLSQVDPVDPDYDVAGDPWAHLNDAARAHAMDLLGRFQSAPRGVQDAYVELRDHLHASTQKLLLGAVNSLRTEMGLRPIQNLRDFDAEASDWEAARRKENARRAKAGIELLPEQRFTASTRAALQNAIRTTLEGDYFPMQRDGRYALYARQTVRFTSTEGKADAEAQYKAAAQANVHLRPLGPGRSAQAVQTTDRSGAVTWVVEAEIPYFRLFDSESDAEQAREAMLASRATGTPLVLAGEAADPQVNRLNFLPDEVGGVLTENEIVGRNVGLTDAQGAALKDLAQNNRELRNILLDMLPDRNVAAAIRTRDNVLGAPREVMETMQTYSVMVGNQLGEVLSRPAVRQTLQEMEAQHTQAKLNTMNLSGRAYERAKRRADDQGALLAFMQNRDAQSAGGHLSIVPDWMNSRLSKYVTFTFLSGLSHPIINALQVYSYAVPQFSSRYGAASVAQLAKHNAYWVGVMAAKGLRRFRDPGYYAEASLIDVRAFGTDGADPRTGAAAVRAADAIGETYEQLANRPAPGFSSIRIDEVSGMPDAMLLSEFEFDLYKAGKLSWGQLRAISKARGGRHLGSTFFEEQRVAKLEAGLSGYLSERTLNNALDLFTVPAQAMEYANRISVVLAGYEMEVRQRNDGRSDDSTLTETDYADIEAVLSDLNARVNVDYSTENRAMVQRKAGVLAQFTSFPLNMMLESYMMIRAALWAPGKGGYTRREAATAMAVQFLTIGSVAGFAPGAIPFVAGAALKLVALGMADLFGEAEDDNLWGDILKYGPSDAVEKKMRAFDPLLADLFFRGPLGTATGVALTDRLGVHMAPVLIDDESPESIALSFLGPAVAYGLNAFRAIEKAETEDTIRTVERLSPKVLKDILKSMRYSDEGVVDGKGVVQITPEELQFTDGALQQLLGFTPAKVNTFYEKQSLEFEMQDRATDERARIYKRFYEGDVDALEDLPAFNTLYPDDAITGEKLLQSYMARLTEQAGNRVFGGLSTETPLRSMEIERVKGD